jgi:hypothetical protein
VGCASPVLVSQSLMLLSSDPEARMRLSGDQDIHDTPARWASSVCSSSPVALLQSLIVQSLLAEAM